jgi:hypothetical protein
MYFRLPPSHPRGLRIRPTVNELARALPYYTPIMQDHLIVIKALPRLVWTPCPLVHTYGTWSWGISCGLLVDLGKNPMGEVS